MRSLLACSLTCKSWLPRSRHYKFASVEFHGRRASFRDCPIAALYVQNLVVQGAMVSEVEFNCCPKLQTVTFDSVHFSDIAIAAFHSANGCHRVTRLRLNMCRVTNLAAIIYSFPALTSLSLEYVTWIGPADNHIPATSVTGVPPLSGRLYIESHRQRYHRYSLVRLLHALSDLPHGVQFQSVEIDSAKHIWAEPLNKLLKACGPHLRSLLLGNCLLEVGEQPFQPLLKINIMMFRQHTYHY